MPCYCDVPDSKNQEEIERRCKEKMYFDAIKLLTDDQIIECEKIGINPFPKDVNSHLCKICKVLTDEQMKNISAYYWQIEWPHETLYDWYEKHKQDDLKEIVGE